MRSSRGTKIVLLGFMKKIIPRLAFSVAIMTLIIPALLFGATSEPEAGLSVVRATAPISRSLRLTVSPGATVYRETDGFQTTFSVMQQYGAFFVGLESGYMRWSPSVRADYTGMKVGQTTIPLLATALYRFENDSGVYPYLGGSLGIGLSRRDNGDGNHFETIAYVRPGVEFEIAEVLSFTIEPRVGLLDDSFLFAPMVGLSISL